MRTGTCIHFLKNLKRNGIVGITDLTPVTIRLCRLNSLNKHVFFSSEQKIRIDLTVGCLWTKKTPCRCKPKEHLKIIRHTKKKKRKAFGTTSASIINCFGLLVREDYKALGSIVTESGYIHALCNIVLMSIIHMQLRETVVRNTFPDILSPVDLQTDEIVFSYTKVTVQGSRLLEMMILMAFSVRQALSDVNRLCMYMYMHVHKCTCIGWVKIRDITIKRYAVHGNNKCSREYIFPFAYIYFKKK